jgi:hypothetical protein
MDQTSFSLLMGLLVGSHVGAFGLRSLTGWSLWITYPTAGVVGLIVFAAATFLFIECVGRLVARLRKKG